MWDRHQTVNVKGTFLLSQAVARIMVRQGGGKIINIASDSGVAPTPEGAAAYCASKSAIIGLTRVIAKELGRYRVYCNAICPGAIRTPMTERFLKTTRQKENSLEAWAEMAALKRVGEPEDVGRVALFLACHLSDFLTGEHLLVTGGDIMSQ
jgi:NAD(P)-dependent dehydrogenase (short-subunit alcohol dehydrogenase family)